MRRRTLLATGAAVLAAPHIGRAADAKTLKFIPESDATIVDPIWTTATVTRNHGYLVFDTLYGQNDAFAMEPQMVEGHTVENDGKLWRLTLREGLRFHDGEPVRAQDVVPSIKRFAARDAFGRALMDTTDEMRAASDRVIEFRLKKPFPLLPNALGKSGTIMPAIMPERLAITDPNKQVTEMVGSGPFTYAADEHVSGSRVVYKKFAGYVPRPDGVGSFTAGPKVVHIDRVEWQVVPDPSTALSALMQGEVDWWQEITPDQLPLLRRGKTMQSRQLDPGGGIGVLRFNALYPPFDNPAIRRALLGAINQADFMTAIAGDDHNLWKDRVGVFSPGTPMASQAGIEVLTKARDLDRVRKEIIDAGYKGETVVVLTPADYPGINPLGIVAADVMTRVGLKVDVQSVDWGTVVQRRSSRKPIDQGGWSAFVTFLNGTNNFDPAGQLGIRGNGDQAWFGWPKAPKLEEARDAWFAAPDLAGQKAACERLQLQFWQDATYLPLGAFYATTAYRRDVTGMRSGFPQFYDIKLD
ncbi:ABC transporter substrate-binding protein [Acidisphaera sp. L21]|uniref:ABC transporter substrate-binding protein n=1 Tax=Acidisphaera sp. L21 TaxID=1641851 RepID=UPI00131C315D|nr:ABC transporter substrate-binding protein [Acidisphaera sp. L21]